MHSRTLVLATLLALAGARLAAAGAPPPQVVVSAAVSLTEALESVARDFDARTGVRVTLNFGASNSLARQVLAGAPVDVFVSADEDQMRLLEEAGRVAPGTRIDLLANRLVVVVPSGRLPVVRGPRDLLSPSVRRI